MAVQLLTPFTMVNRRSAIKGAGDALTGRLTAVDSTGKLTAPGTQKQGLYLILEGNLIHTGSNTAFGAGPAFASSSTVTLPSVAASGACAIAYGVFRYEVGPEGCDPTDAGIVAGALVQTDAAGRLVNAGATAANAFAVVETVTRDGATNITDLVVRTLGN
jgi:hypothetical protein